MWITIFCSFVQVVLMGFMGQVVNTHTEFTQNHRGKLLWGFMLASIIVFAFAAWSALNQARDDEARWANVTGGDSYPIVVPQSQLPKIGLVIWNFGSAPLTGVNVKIQCGVTEPWHVETVGTIPSHGSEFLSEMLVVPNCADTSTIRGETVATYLLQISAQNGNYTEILQFMKSKTCPDYWSNRYTLDKNAGVGVTKDNPKPHLLPDEQKRVYIAPNDLKAWPKGWVGKAECL